MTACARSSVSGTVGSFVASRSRNHVRIVIECDGKQHYADDDGRANPRKYAEMVAEDRALRVRGYEVYRFGGHELKEGSETRIGAFLDALHARHNLAVE
ncbi:DUF559 domain-containing protein [Micromonospora sp. NPDC005173]|uniref:DUF559 domain-containing protein n=1 Tax=Micromonospora sp. NPDC005173 TaxID=3157165 RepID=UPI0033A043E9